MNSFGSKFRVSIFGESHGPVVGVVLDGVPAGIALADSDFMADIERRMAGARGTTPRRESDRPEIVSGVFRGLSTGAPLAILFRNENIRPEDYDGMMTHPRPSHADFAAQVKFGGFNDHRGGGHFSGRLTLPLVAAGVVAKKMLADQNIEINAHITEIGGCGDPAAYERVVEDAMNDGDSVGGIIECIAENISAGLGEPFFDSMESVIAHLLFSVPAIKGVEFGSGFEAARMRGSEHNDPIVAADGRTATNNSGGITGGLTNANPLVVRVAVKPTPSISAIQNTVDLSSGKVEPLKIEGRHDSCIALRVPVIVEAAVAVALAQF